MPPKRLPKRKPPKAKAPPKRTPKAPKKPPKALPKKNEGKRIKKSIMKKQDQFGVAPMEVDQEGPSIFFGR
jgi:hypothetical protein